MNSTKKEKPKDFLEMMHKFKVSKQEDNSKDSIRSSKPPSEVNRMDITFLLN